MCVTGLTFGYAEDGACVGYCRAKRLLYFSTCGGFFGERNLGFEYVKALAAMLGIETCVPYIAEGLDIDPARRDEVLEQAIAGCKARRAVWPPRMCGAAFLRQDDKNYHHHALTLSEG